MRLTGRPYLNLRSAPAIHDPLCGPDLVVAGSAISLGAAVGAFLAICLCLIALGFYLDWRDWRDSSHATRFGPVPAYRIIIDQNLCAAEPTAGSAP